ncbi:Methyltransferase domain-containing protein [Mariniphaga anaerophila]|uniref:Arsenite methyltransferase n=1 Tax=Mariniphaga anaerophila TaxID=1484053 RepID=A0A1M5EXP6_9BACT|nr:class I SAM-dependent methyltransferase [Mariniphaga anaerophila]SHF84015.1 Methyltransferase domain-containing protein [Mariniphaga anaerophila]
MKTIEESVVLAMDGDDEKLFPYLPYILQDIWEIGADPGVIIDLISSRFRNCADLNVLDLGCGKGAVSVRVAKELGCRCLGIDAVEAFIAVAQQKSQEYQVRHLCTFEAGDIRKRVNSLSGFDVVVLGAIGPVFGNYYETLTTLFGCLNRKGIFIIDDGYIGDESEFCHPQMFKRKEMLEQIHLAGMEIVEQRIFPRKELVEEDECIFKRLKKRCLELSEKHPDKQQLFFDYIRKQEVENDILENKIVVATMVIKARN